MDGTERDGPEKEGWQQNAGVLVSALLLLESNVNTEDPCFSVALIRANQLQSD